MNYIALIKSGVLSFLYPLIRDWLTQVGQETMQEAKAAATEFIKEKMTIDGWTDEEIATFVSERLEQAAEDGKITWDEHLVNRVLPITIRWARTNATKIIKKVKK